MNYHETTHRVEISGKGYTMMAAWNEGHSEAIAEAFDLFLLGMRRQLKEHGKAIPQPSAPEAKEESH